MKKKISIKQLVRLYFKRVRENKRKMKVKFLMEQGIAMYDVTVRDKNLYLSINGALIPADAFKNLDNTLEDLRQDWLLKNLN